VPLDARRFRNALGQFPTGVTIITTVTATGERLGMTISSFNSLSLDPPLVLFSIGRSAKSFAAWQKATHYAINVLSEGEEELSNQFARPLGEKWAGQSITTGRTGMPLLPNAATIFECEAHARHDGGDHEIFVGHVIELHENLAQHGNPLVFFGGKYRKIAREAQPLPPGEADSLHGWVADLGF